jgi:hypothetical protein
MLTKAGFHIHRLDETDRYFLGHIYEDVILVNKITQEETFIGDHYGDPVCGVIGPGEDWFVTCGERVLYFDFKRGLHELLRSGFPEKPNQRGRGPNPAFIHACRLQSRNEVTILVDLWSQYASTWVLNTDTISIEKVADGPSLRDEP